MSSKFWITQDPRPLEKIDRNDFAKKLLQCKKIETGTDVAKKMQKIVIDREYEHKIEECGLAGREGISGKHTHIPTSGKNVLALLPQLQSLSRP